MLQYTAYTEIGVSKAMPLSTGMQLLGTSLLGVIAFGEWASAQSKLIGFASVTIVIVGVIITSYQENKKKNDNANMKKAVIVLLVSAVGYVGYSGFPVLSAQMAGRNFASGSRYVFRIRYFFDFYDKGQCAWAKIVLQKYIARACFFYWGAHLPAVNRPQRCCDRFHPVANECSNRNARGAYSCSVRKKRKKR